MHGLSFKIQLKFTNSSEKTQNNNNRFLHNCHDVTADIEVAVIISITAELQEALKYNVVEISLNFL